MFEESYQMKSFTCIRLVVISLAACIGGGTVVGCAANSPEPEGSTEQSLWSPNLLEKSDEKSDQTLTETLDKGTCTAIFTVGANGGSCQLAAGGNHCNGHYSPDVYTNPNPDPNDVTSYCLCYCNDLPGPGATKAAESESK
jgi:hypothetical protein